MSFRYVFNESETVLAPVLVLFHSTGGDEYSLLSLAESIAPDAAVLSLRGNRKENGMNRFFNRFSEGGIDLDDLKSETEHIHRFLAKFGLKHGFTHRKVIGVGYSNGANMIVSLLHHEKPVFNGAILFHGTDYRSADIYDDLEGLSVFVAAGFDDPLISQASVKQMILNLNNAHAEVQEKWSSAGHQLTEVEVDASRKWYQSFVSGDQEMKGLLKEINRLARVAKIRPLNSEERETQGKLRKRYLDIFRGTFRQNLLNVKLIDEKGNDVTPNKVKVIQAQSDQMRDERKLNVLKNRMKEAEIMNQLLGIHHISIVTSNAKTNFSFYTKVLGMRLVKKTVNQDDVSVYHLFYADQKGSPGTDLTFFEFPGTRPTQKGTNSISRVSLRVPSDKSLDYWNRRFDEFKVSHHEISTLFGHKMLEFEDFDGTPLRLISDEKDKGVAGGIPWENGPVPIEYAIRGLGSVTLTVSRLGMIRSFLKDVLHFREVAREEENILFEVGEGGHGAQIIVREDQQHMDEVPGFGSVHHLALRVADQDALNEWIKVINQTGLPNSGFVDRFYFKSLYVREFNHILFEFATDGPGFTSDEDESALGSTLSLPPFLEGRREFIENQLEPLDLK